MIQRHTLPECPTEPPSGGLGTISGPQQAQGAPSEVNGTDFIFLGIK